MNMTDWLGPMQTPVRDGVYETRTWPAGEGASIGCAEWRGHRAGVTGWFGCDGEPWGDTLTPDMAWRGCVKGTAKTIDWFGPPLEEEEEPEDASFLNELVGLLCGQEAAELLPDPAAVAAIERIRQGGRGK